MRGAAAAEVWEKTLKAIGRYAPGALVHVDLLAPSQHVRGLLVSFALEFRV